MKRYKNRYTEIGISSPSETKLYRLYTDCIPIETNRYTLKRLVRRLNIQKYRFITTSLKKKKNKYIYRGIEKNGIRYKPKRRLFSRPVKGITMCIYDELPDGGYLVACNGFVVDEDFVHQHARGVFEFCPWCGCMIVRRDMDMQEHNAYAEHVNASVDRRREW